MRLNTKQFILLIVLGLLTGLNDCYSIAQEGKEYNIIDFGAISDGKTLNTEIIQNIIDIASENGGGRVIVPHGEFLTGTIEMKSNVELHLKNKATLLGSTNPFHYKSLEMKGRPESPKKDDNSQLALLVAYNVENILISGKGTIDGQGRALALNIDSLHHCGIVVDPEYSRRTNRPNAKMRPKLLRFSTCRNITLLQTTFKSAACWGLSFELCNGLLLDSLTIYNRAYWNNDGIDVTDSKNVRISNCDINSADDAICLKSYYPGYYNDSIYIYDCKVISGASAIKFGTASYGGFRNITIQNIKILDTYRSAIAIESVDGGIIENININNIIADNTGNAIFIRLGHRDGGKPGIVKKIRLSDIKVQVPFARADINYDLRAMEPSSHHNPIPSSITGIPGHYIEDVIIENVEISYPGRSSKGQAYIPLSRLNQVPERTKNYPEYSMFGELPSWGFYTRHAKGIQMKNVTFQLKDYEFRPALIFDDVKGIYLEEVKLPDNMQNKQIILKDYTEFKIYPPNDNLIKIIE